MGRLSGDRNEDTKTLSRREDYKVLLHSMMRFAFLVLACSLTVGCGCSQTNRHSTPKDDRMLDAEVLEEISTLVRSGFYDRDRLMSIFLEEMYAPGELDETSVAGAIKAATEEWNDEKTQWPAVTDCDRLDNAFAAINKRGIIAIQNSGYTQSDGYDDFRELYGQHPNKSEVIGYCFYHGQDLERAVRGGGLYLAFGPADPTAEETLGPQVGNVVREELTRVGLDADWDGTFATRVHIPRFVWQKR